MKNILMKVLLLLFVLTRFSVHALPYDISFMFTTKTVEEPITGKWVFESTSKRGKIAKSFIELLGDGRYLYSDGLGSQIDVFRIDSKSKAVVIADIGEIKSEDLAKKNSDFNLTRSGKKSTVKTQKHEPFEESDRTKNLSQNWILLGEEDGKDSVRYIPKTILTFSKYGTCVIQAFQNEKVKPFITIRSWEWHPTEKNIISLRSKNQESKEPSGYFLVKALDDKRLSVIEVSKTKRRSFIFQRADK
ncbi:hypothetical protein [Dyadobacter sp. 32]|uniref:hypothetical protein n=1 Tax=Dyadobacter sp. 32 TaxID=538966 RepID=UPI0011EBDA4E